MSKKKTYNSPFINPLTGEERPYKFRRPHKSNRHPRLTPFGSEILDSTPINVEFEGMRPMTSRELFERFDSGQSSPRLVPVEFDKYDPTDLEFGDFMDGDEEFVSPHDDRALALNKKVKKIAQAERKKAKADKKALKKRDEDSNRIYACGMDSYDQEAQDTCKAWRTHVKKKEIEGFFFAGLRQSGVFFKDE